jgi:hypothetical protein
MISMPRKAVPPPSLLAFVQLSLALLVVEQSTLSDTSESVRISRITLQLRAASKILHHPNIAVHFPKCALFV